MMQNHYIGSKDINFTPMHNGTIKLGPDPGFPVRRHQTHWGGGGAHLHPTLVLFGENVCENEGIGSYFGGGGVYRGFVNESGRCFKSVSSDSW